MDLAQVNNAGNGQDRAFFADTADQFFRFRQRKAADAVYMFGNDYVAFLQVCNQLIQHRSVCTDAGGLFFIDTRNVVTFSLGLFD
ncbi:Uncharacterised protein [Neisseria sicca]|nr:Uncharacterised protein [Neisseria sicca]